MLKIFPVETDEEIEIVKTLFVEYAESLGFDLGFQNFEEELANFPGCYAPPAGRLLLAKYNGKAAGCIGLRKLSDDVCEMKRLFVRPKYQRLGAGRALSEAVIERAKKVGYTHMRLATALEPPKALYKSLGFKEIAPYEYVPVEIEGVVFMELKLV